MATIAMLQQIDEGRLAAILQELGTSLNGTDRDVVLDFSSVRRLDASGVQALEELISTAEQKPVKVVLRGVSVSVYKVLKLVNLTSRVSFTN